MKKKFSLFTELTTNVNTINNVDNCIKITLGPNGKNGLVLTNKTEKISELKIITNGSLLIKALEFEKNSNTILLKLLEQVALKTNNISGDGSTTVVLLSCQLLKTSLRFLTNGYNSIFLSNGLKKIAYFFLEKIIAFSNPIQTSEDLIGVLKTCLGKKLAIDLKTLLYKSISKLDRDGLILIEENISPLNEIEIVQGIELDRGFASSYFVNDTKNFEVNYENPYLLITSIPITNINQIREVIDFIKKKNRPLIIIAEEITKEIISTLVLNTIQKKFKIAVINYKSIKFLKTGILEDLSILTYSNYMDSTLTKKNLTITSDDLGQVEKVIIKKDKSTFLISKFTKLIAKRRINELTRDLLTSETDYEKTIFKTRIARLSGNITKIKIGVSNQYEVIEQRQKIENAILTLKGALEEGVLPGGGIFYLQLREELKNWAYLNLIGDELFSSQIVLEALIRPFDELFSNNNISKYSTYQMISKFGYPFGYNLIDKTVINTFKDGLIDSAKTVRSILWNSLTIVSTIITSE